MYRRRSASRSLSYDRHWTGGLIHAIQSMRAQPAEPRLVDAVMVSRAAEIAEISEFDLFRAAWQGWNGTLPQERGLERLFSRYLQEQEVPGFVRHFARRVIDDAEAGRLNRGLLGLHNFRRREALPDLRCGFTVEILSLALIGYIAFLI